MAQDFLMKPNNHEYNDIKYPEYEQDEPKETLVYDQLLDKVSKLNNTPSVNLKPLKKNTFFLEVIMKKYSPEQLLIIFSAINEKYYETSF